MLICLGYIQESELDTIDLSGDGSLVSHLVRLHFLYTGDYPTLANTSYVEDPSTADNPKHTSRDVYTDTHTESSDSIDGFPAKPQSVAVSASDNKRHPKGHSPNSTTAQKAATPKPSRPDYSIHVRKCTYALAADNYDIPALGHRPHLYPPHLHLNWAPDLIHSSGSTDSTLRIQTKGPTSARPRSQAVS